MHQFRKPCQKVGSEHDTQQMWTQANTDNNSLSSVHGSKHTWTYSKWLFKPIVVPILQHEFDLEQSSTKPLASVAQNLVEPRTAPQHVADSHHVTNRLTAPAHTSAFGHSQDRLREALIVFHISCSKSFSESVLLNTNWFCLNMSRLVSSHGRPLGLYVRSCLTHRPRWELCFNTLRECSFVEYVFSGAPWGY